MSIPIIGQPKSTVKTPPMKQPVDFNLWRWKKNRNVLSKPMINASPLMNNICKWIIRYPVPVAFIIALFPDNVSWGEIPLIHPLVVNWLFKFSSLILWRTVEPCHDRIISFFQTIIFLFKQTIASYPIIRERFFAEIWGLTWKSKWDLCCEEDGCQFCRYDGRILLRAFQRQKPLMQNI